MPSLALSFGALPISRVPLAANLRGPFHQLFDAVPSLDSLYFQWEKDYDPLPGNDFVKANRSLPIVFTVIYCVSIVAGTRYMRDRKPFDLRWSLAAWNLLLSLFSCWGMIRTVPHVAYNAANFSFDDLLCKPAATMYGCGATGLWVQLFIFSKVPELFDTLFIVLRKKKLVFLHWYHHLTVLLFCWHSYATESPSGLYFCAMNYTVHFVMYGYYFLMAAKILPKWFPAGLITIAQIGQMVIGVLITVASGVLYAAPRSSGSTCDVKFENLVAGGVMYASYFALFMHFAWERYFLAPRRKQLAKAQEAKTQ